MKVSKITKNTAKDWGELPRVYLNFSAGVRSYVDDFSMALQKWQLKRLCEKYKLKVTHKFDNQIWYVPIKKKNTMRAKRTATALQELQTLGGRVIPAKSVCNLKRFEYKRGWATVEHDGVCINHVPLQFLSVKFKTIN